MAEMKLWTLYGPEDLRLESRARPDPMPNEILLKTRRAGICGSDVHYFLEGKIGSFVPRAPFALGHEFSGTVEKTGAAVSSLHEGDPVAVEPSMPCGTCRYCRTGRYNLCLSMRFFGSASCFPHLDGGFSEYVVVPEQNCFRLPEGMSFQQGAFAEPLSVGLHAALRAGGLQGKSVLITGGGTIGQMALAASRALGAGSLSVSDPSAFARRMAAESKADYVFDPADSDTAGEIENLFPGGFDVVFEASGSPAALRYAVLAAARGGTIVQIGTQPKTAELPVNAIMAKELAVMGSFRYANVFGTAVSLLSSKRIKTDHLVSKVYPFDELDKAVLNASEGKDIVKIQVEF